MRCFVVVFSPFLPFLFILFYSFGGRGNISISAIIIYWVLGRESSFLKVD